MGLVSIRNGDGTVHRERTMTLRPGDGTNGGRRSLRCPSTFCWNRLWRCSGDCEGPSTFQQRGRRTASCDQRPGQRTDSGKPRRRGVTAEPNYTWKDGGGNKQELALRSRGRREFPGADGPQQCRPDGNKMPATKVLLSSHIKKKIRTGEINVNNSVFNPTQPKYYDFKM